MKYKTRVLKTVIVPVNEPIFSEYAVMVEIVDESGGEFVEVSDSLPGGERKVAIDPEQWPQVRKAIDKMIKNCRPERVES